MMSILAQGKDFGVLPLSVQWGIAIRHAGTVAIISCQMCIVMLSCCRIPGMRMVLRYFRTVRSMLGEMIWCSL
jgi:hypothetical protein